MENVKGGKRVEWVESNTSPGICDCCDKTGPRTKIESTTTGAELCMDCLAETLKTLRPPVGPS